MHRELYQFVGACAFVVGLLSSGCATSTPFYGESRFTAAERTEIERAAEEWNRATHGLAQVNIIWTDGLAWHARTIKKVSTERLHLEHPGNGAYTTLTYGVEPQTVIELNAANGRLYERSLHEFGHALGLYHAGPGTVMQSDVAKQASCVTAADLVAFCDLEGCDASQLAPCTP